MTDAFVQVDGLGRPLPPLGEELPMRLEGGDRPPVVRSRNQYALHLEGMIRDLSQRLQAGERVFLREITDKDWHIAAIRHWAERLPGAVVGSAKRPGQTFGRPSVFVEVRK